MSAFQKAIRGDCTVLHDHICKEMNELNLERCRCIPKNTPGADWRVLQEIVAANPERTTFKVWSDVTISLMHHLVLSCPCASLMQ